MSLRKILRSGPVIFCHYNATYVRMCHGPKTLREGLETSLELLRIMAKANALRYEVSSCDGASQAPEAAVHTQLPEAVWTQVGSFCALQALLRGGSASSLLRRAFSKPWLPALLDIDLAGTVREDSFASLVRKCSMLRSLVASVSVRNVSLGEQLLLCSKGLATLKLDLQGIEARNVESIIACVEALGSGACASLVSLSLRIHGISVGDPALRALCGRGPHSPMPNLKHLQLLDGWSIRDRPLKLADGGGHMTLLNYLIQRFKNLQALSMTESLGAKRYRRLSNEFFGPRFNTETADLLPPLRITCGRCSRTLYRSLTSYLLGPPTQGHISFELFTQQDPDYGATYAVENLHTRRNCAHDCHSAEGCFLLAGWGDFIDTRNFRWAIACGKNLANVHADDGSFSSLSLIRPHRRRAAILDALAQLAVFNS